jgi:hypothetical protein
MPIKPENRKRYPKNWKGIRAEIINRAGNRCECLGHCGLHNGRRCIEENGNRAQFARGRVVLTVAHLDHTPENCDPSNLLAMCQRCHLRYDVDHHKENAAKTRREKLNQRDLFD